MKRRRRGDEDSAPAVSGAPSPLSARTPTQKSYLSSIARNTITFGVGPAGTGKTYVSAAYAADRLRAGTIQKIIVTRPAMEAGESLGFLPGTLEEKFEPFLRPLREVFYERLGRGQTDYALKTRQIEAIPLAYLQGLTFKDAVVLLDEAQNTSIEQMKMFLTRIGDGAKVVISGDPTQNVVQRTSGLADAVGRLENIRGVGVVYFDDEDIVRSGITRDIVIAYRS